MHIGASTHAEFVPLFEDASWAVRLSEILVSAVDCGAPGSASAAGAGGNARSTATIEHMTKLSKDEVAELTRNLAEEWKAVLTTTQDSTGAVATPERHSNDSHSGYWSEKRQRKVRRVASGLAP